MLECIGCRSDDGGNKELGVADRPVAVRAGCFSWIRVECCIDEMGSRRG